MPNDAGYAPVNGLRMYYEIHGSGEPLVVLPGAYMTVELMGDLVPALAKSRQVIAYSLGGGAALQLGLRHPGNVRKLVIASASSSSDGLYPEVVGGIENITPEMFDGTPWRDAYDRTAPDPSAFPTLVEKLKQLDLTPFDWRIDELAAPALVLIGDADGTRLEHAVEMFRRLGGGIFGDLAPELPASQLAILPGTTHVGMLERADWISSMVTTFLAT
jgi:pimeloyl-ACP methyl ester carboxylesterase